VTFEELVALLHSMGDIAGERDGLSELDHGLQCAFELARVRPEDGELHIAGLIHDIGHQFGSDAEHGRLGAAEVRDLLGERVAGLIEGHVPAKRFLVATDEHYAAVLSEDSTETLKLQGGPMTEVEVAQFSNRPFSDDAVLLRRADDRAKVPGQRVPSLDHWLEVVEQLARTRATFT
jgi:predicted HD phosphohydrolase